MSLTLNQVIQRMRVLALSHYQLKTFVEEESEVIDIVYPALVCQKQPGSIDKANHATNLNFKLVFIDKNNVSEEAGANRLEVESDMLSIAQDYKALLESPEYEDWDVSLSSPFQWVNGNYNDDEVAGVTMDITISVPYLSNRCQVPFYTDFITIFISDLMIKKYNATGDEGGSWIMTELIGKRVISVFRQEAYKRVVTVTPASSDEVYFDSVTGLVQLFSGDTLGTGEKIDFLYSNK